MTYEGIQKMWLATSKRNAENHPDCPQCQRIEDVHKPMHDASMFCESGKHPHCTCDRCY